MRNEHTGLKKMRNNKTDNKPTFNCDNCKCARYSPCGCTKKDES